MRPEPQILRDEKGTPLEVKQGVILDAEGNALTSSSEENHEQNSSSSFRGTKIIRVGTWALPLVLMGGAIVLIFGTLFLGVFFAAFLVVALIRTLLKSLLTRNTRL